MGKGLLPQLYNERQSIATDLSKLVSASGKPSQTTDGCICLWAPNHSCGDQGIKK